ADRLNLAVAETVTACDDAALAIDRQTLALKEAGDAALTAGGKSGTAAGEAAGFGSKAKMAFLGIGAAAIYSTVKAAQFQTQVPRLYTAAGLTGQNISKVSQAIIQVGNSTGFTGTQMAEAMYH